MTPEQVALVKQTWTRLRPQSEQVAVTFYEELFKRDDTLHDLFKGDMREQAQRLANMLDVVMNALENFDELHVMLENLGVRHLGYGVQEEDYTVFCDTLLKTIQTELGDGWNNEIETAWQVTLVELMAVMTKAATEQGISGAAN